MKKLLLVVFALVTGTTFAQNNANDQAEVLAEIVAPISVVADGSLDFGRIAVGTAGGTVRVDTNGSRTGDSGLLIDLDEGSSASFKINAASGYQYTINLDGSDLTHSNGETIAATYFHSKGTDAEASYSGSGEETVTVGGELTLAANQEPGAYTGTVTMTVSYE